MNDATDRDDESKVARVRDHLIEMIDDPWKHAPSGWSFALMRRAHPDPLFCRNAVIGYVTRTESGCLTHAMIRDLPSPLYLHGGKAQLELVPVTDQREVDDQPAPGILIRTLAYGEHPVGCVTAMSALDLAPEGLLLSSELPTPARGWPQ